MRPKREPANARDVHAVVRITKTKLYVYNLAPTVSAFLRDVFAEVTEQKSCALTVSTVQNPM